jgi:hypothetical protein
VKTCKDLNIELCYECKNNNSKKCWIEHYKNEIEEINFEDIIEDYIDGPEVERNIYFIEALQIYQPEWYEKLNKLLALI